MQAALEPANPPVGSGTGSSLKKGEETAAIECLGDDVLCLLLGRLRTRHVLQSAALVCKRWHQLCMVSLSRQALLCILIAAVSVFRFQTLASMDFVVVKFLFMLCCQLHA
jgi:hypothetical protein